MIPNFLIVGAAKSGTSSLDRYLAQHPEIYIPTKKEAHFYSIPDFPERFTGPGDEGMNDETIRQRADYEALFDARTDEPAVGESSVFYLYYPGTAARIYADNPEMKIIIVLREPVARAYSAYMHLIRDARETLSFEDSLAAEEERKKKGFEPMWLYRDLGRYSEQIERYLDVFGAERLHVMLFDEFTKQSKHYVRGVFRFLGVDEHARIDTQMHHNESGVPRSRAAFDFVSKPHPLKEWVKPFIPQSVRERLGNRAKSMLLERTSMRSETRRELSAYFAPDIAKLEKLLKRDLSHWKKS
ncbi:sulfotransferase family protein [Ferroacidibacillus organovorans]|uniref:Sulfotransferase n=1 Tax=Ferroacidibacillus organovorans TaxID=1765683 RepID=A0A124IW64_9BACL|nr:sulfotransferase [Ferroacidibacillus organovorans]KUO96439.1 sulfotransferase [Ferroacidibacillus organovorans]